jgi:hypothetical protein
MQWFSRAKHKDIWDQPLDAPVGDIEAAKRIREICLSATDSAVKVGAAADRSDRKVKRDLERYEHAARMAMEIAMKVSDELLRDAAVRQIIELCLKAGNTTTAKTLFRAIQSKSIRDEVRQDFPQLQP